MKEAEIFDLLAAVHQRKPFQIKRDGTKCWKHKGHVIEVGPTMFSPEDFALKKNLVIDGREVQVNWERAVDHSLLKKK